jgi:transposase
MRFQASVFGQLMQVVSRRVFQAAVVGRAKARLSDWGHFTVLVAAQLAGARSLREVEQLAAHHGGVLAHFGLAGVARTTLADANLRRATAPFEAVAGQLSAEVARFSKGLGREALRLIDATRIHAGKRVRAWAADGAVKLHLVFDPVTQRSTYFAVTSARVNDISAAKRMPIEAKATYVFDRGYYDFGFWARLQAAGCRFVTRLKANTPIAELRRRRIPKGAAQIRADVIGTLPQRQAASRRNPYPKPVRVIEVEISSGRVITLLTNDLKAPAASIAALYKSRWEIELFFKWVKQNLRLQRFLGTSRNAITLQIIAALIAHLLVRLAQLRGQASIGAQALFRLLPPTCFQRRPLDQLLALPNPAQPPDLPQQAFDFGRA